MEKCRNRIKYLFECLLESIYPIEEKCYVCNEEGDKIICNKCMKKIPKANDLLNMDGIELMVCSYYSFIVKDLVLRLKYKGDFHAGEILVLLLEERFKKAGIEVDYITYVPVAKDALKKKEFNQCEFLAKELARKLNIEYIQVLKKKNKVKEQKVLTKDEREKNVKEAFVLIDNNKLENKRVLLLDDVMTTGSTLKACTKELKKIKDIKIFLLTIAKSNI